MLRARWASDASRTTVSARVGSLFRVFNTSRRPMASYTAKHWWTPETVAVVTGANKGIGKEIVRLLAGQQLTVVATARNEKAGKEAVEEIKASVGPDARVDFHTLDVSDPGSHQQFKDWLQNKYGSFSILVNNAGFAYKGDVFGPEELRITLATNYYGTAALTDTLLPLLKDQEGHVVTVSSRAGLTSILRSDQLKQRFQSAKSKAEVDALLEEFTALVDQGDDSTMLQAGWPKSMYGVSKLAITTYCRILSEQVAGRGIKVAACCPGWCQTDMSSHRGNKTAAEGADTPVWLALQPNEDLATGQLWGERVTVRP